ncbi:MAG: CBS domain-containing protein [Nanoarchaeota archaeon]|nr:CBS domain-containing protein [Nanoarchaeota archaeon]MBU1135704.1 CBS domain-containing protein [Nanoarchaeota archaeon]MBU2520504.1 CBS domain-containing protein [Nanoarchaeota archaeon]
MLRYRLDELIDPKRPALSIASINFPVCKETASIRNVLKMLMSDRGSRVAVVDSEGMFKGLVTDIDVLGYLGGDNRYNDYVTSKTEATYKKIKAKNIHGINSPIKKIMDIDVHTLKKNQSIRQALNIFKKTGQNALPIVNNSGKILGILSKRNLIEAMFTRFLKSPEKRSKELMIKNIMVKPMIIKEHFPINEVSQMMCMGGFRRFPVTEKGITTGMITVHDLLYFLNVNRNLENLKTEKRPIKHLVNKKIVSVESETSVNDAIKLMLAKKIGALPITEDDEIKGMVTFTDIIDTIK